MANQYSVSPRSALALCVGGALSLAVAMGIGRFAFTPVLPVMIQEGRLDLAAGGWIAAANYAGYLLGALTAARMRWSAVLLSTVALGATVALTAAMALPVSPWGWAAMRLAAGACSAWAFVGTAVWCLGGLAALRRPGLASAVYSGVGLGIAVAGVHALVAGSAGVSAPGLWLQLTALALVMLVPVAVVLQRVPSAPARAAAPPAVREPLPPGTPGLIVCYVVLGFGYILPATFLPAMARELVADPRIFGLAWPIFGATAAASTFVAGQVLRRASRLQVWAASHVVMGVGVLLPSLWHSAAAIACSALMVGGTFMIVTMVGVQEMRARAVGDPTRLVGLTTAAFALGQIAGPIASSLLLHVPAFRASGLQLALQIAAVTLFASAAWLWRTAHPSFSNQEIAHAR
jgi:MFS family permease